MFKLIFTLFAIKQIHLWAACDCEHKNKIWCNTQINIELSQGNACIYAPEFDISWVGKFENRGPTKPLVLDQFTKDMHAHLWVSHTLVRLQWWATGKGIHTCDCRVVNKKYQK